MKITGAIFLFLAVANFFVAILAAGAGAGEAAGQKLSAAILLFIIGGVLFYYGKQKEKTQREQGRIAKEETESKVRERTELECNKKIDVDLNMLEQEELHKCDEELEAFFDNKENFDGNFPQLLNTLTPDDTNTLGLEEPLEKYKKYIRFRNRKSVKDLIISENADLKFLEDAKTGRFLFECGSIKGYVTPAAVEKMSSGKLSDFQYAEIGVDENNYVPYVLVKKSNHKVVKTFSVKDAQSIETGDLGQSKIGLRRKDYKHGDFVFYKGTKYQVENVSKSTGRLCIYRGLWAGYLWLDPEDVIKVEE